MGHSRNCNTRSKPLCIQQGQAQWPKVSSTIFQRDSSFLLRFTGLSGLLWGSISLDTGPSINTVGLTWEMPVLLWASVFTNSVCGFALCFQWIQTMRVLGEDSVHGELSCSCHHQGLGPFRHSPLCIWRDGTSTAENNPLRDLGTWTKYNSRPCFGPGNQEIYLFIYTGSLDRSWTHDVMENI